MSWRPIDGHTSGYTVGPNDSASFGAPPIGASGKRENLSHNEGASSMRNELDCDIQGSDGVIGVSLSDKSTLSCPAGEFERDKKARGRRRGRYNNKLEDLRRQKEEQPEWKPQKGSERHRSGSATSDYFSSSHNSPSISTPVRADRRQARVEWAYRSQVEPRIYENPSFRPWNEPMSNKGQSEPQTQSYSRLLGSVGASAAREGETSNEDEDEPEITRR